MQYMKNFTVDASIACCKQHKSLYVAVSHIQYMLQRVFPWDFRGVGKHSFQGFVSRGCLTVDISTKIEHLMKYD